jgi:hypothetical protein
MSDVNLPEGFSVLAGDSHVISTLIHENGSTWTLLSDGTVEAVNHTLRDHKTGEPFTGNFPATETLRTAQKLTQEYQYALPKYAVAVVKWLEALGY